MMGPRVHGESREARYRHRSAAPDCLVTLRNINQRGLTTMRETPEYTAPNSELRAVYATAIDTAGREAANAVCIQHGATAGLHPWRRVPSNKAKACLAALEKLAGGSRGAEKAAKS